VRVVLHEEEVMHNLLNTRLLLSLWIWANLRLKLWNQP